MTESLVVGILKKEYDLEGDFVMVSFVNSFLSYVMLMLVIVALSGGAIALGLFLRKRQTAKENTES